jgi:hypothetical protein
MSTGDVDNFRIATVVNSITVVCCYYDVCYTKILYITTRNLYNLTHQYDLFNVRKCRAGHTLTMSVSP